MYVLEGQGSQLLGIQMYWHELNVMVVAFCKNKYSTGAKQIIDFHPFIQVYLVPRFQLCCYKLDTEHGGICIETGTHNLSI